MKSNLESTQISLPPKKRIRFLFIGCVVLTVILIYGGFLYWLTTVEQESLQFKGQMGDSFGILSSFFSALGFVAVAVTLWMQRGQNIAQENERLIEVDERRSLFNLNASIDATERAKILLEDHNNHRRNWIEAGRLLGHAKSLGERVTLESHKQVLEINRLKYRNFFAALLEDKPAGFFYGTNLQNGTLDDYELASWAGEQLPTGRLLLGMVRQLEEVSLYRIWEASQWPEDFDDPLGKKFTEEDRRRLAFDSEGLRDYLDHIDLKRSRLRQNRG